MAIAVNKNDFTPEWWWYVLVFGLATLLAWFLVSTL